ncbi:MAG: hypothetical protein Rhims3KO_12090 [Hyphomicrobiales bacterium]
MRYLFALPLTLISLGLYIVMAMSTGGVSVFEQLLFSQAMISGGTVRLTQGDALLAFAIAVLFLEVVKATRIGFAPVLDHVFSVLMVMVYLVIFIVWAPASTGLFALLMLIALVDVLAGLWISLNVARRDVAISPGGSF